MRCSRPALPLLLTALICCASLAVISAAEDPQAAEDLQSAKRHAQAAAKLMAEQKLPEALAEVDEAIKLAPKAAGLYALRGDLHFRLAKFTESVADYDRQIALSPSAAAGHWQRGISCYYAQQYDAGAQQFAAYHTKVNDNDVENSVWRCMCMTRVSGVEKARAEMLVVKNDRRVPMMEVYRMFHGDLTPDEVVKTAEAGDAPSEQRNNQIFYAQLYIGLYYDSLGKSDLALKHLQLAVAHPISHYMFTVAKVHAALLEKKP